VRVVSADWQWDPSLYEGSARYYSVGRLPYPPDVADTLRRELGIDRSGRLLDVGCGPGSLTLVLADLFGEAVGVDADPGMIAEAERQALRRGCRNTSWVCTKAESLPAGLGTFRVITLAQSFHWMDRDRVAAILFGMLESDGGLVHVGATTHRGVGDGSDLPGPMPPHDAINELVTSFLGPVRRAGQGVRTAWKGSDEDAVFAGAGFVGPRVLDVGGGRVFRRSEDEVVASVHSLSYAAPHLFGDRLDAFDNDLRTLLRQASPGGEFWERSREIGLSIWAKADTSSAGPDD
jgi:SAM-dependent methyltransferase